MGGKKRRDERAVGEKWTRRVSCEWLRSAVRVSVSLSDDSDEGSEIEIVFLSISGQADHRRLQRPGGG